MVAVPRTHPDVPPLESGMRMRRDEFHELFSAHPEIKKAELVEGIVYVASPTSFGHAKPHSILAGWIAQYAIANADRVDSGDGATVRLSNKTEVMPDLLLRYRNGQSRLRDDGFLEGPPEFVAEIAASSASYDMHQKKDVYRRAGVREYVVWQVWENRLTWWRLEGDSYVEVGPGPDGTIESREFPGLRLSVPALLDGDYATAISPA